MPPMRTGPFRFGGYRGFTAPLPQLRSDQTSGSYPFGGILGVDFFERYGAVIDYRTRTITLRRAVDPDAAVQGDWRAEPDPDSPVPGKPPDLSGWALAVRGRAFTLTDDRAGWVMRGTLDAVRDPWSDAVTLTPSPHVTVALRGKAPVRVMQPTPFQPRAGAVGTMFLSDPAAAMTPLQTLLARPEPFGVRFRRSPLAPALRVVPALRFAEPYLPPAGTPVRIGVAAVAVGTDYAVTLDLPAGQTVFRLDGSAVVTPRRLPPGSGGRTRTRHRG